jgi:NADPH-dependent curcumin reductase CurA
MTRTREWHLVRRPRGVPTDEDFRLVEVELPQPRADDVVVRNTWLSVDPYMRGRMDDRKSYIAPFALGAPMDGGAVGVVEQVGSDVHDLAVGDTVLHGHGWRERFVTARTRVQRVDPGAAPPQAYLGVMGMPGLTAYVGLLQVARMQPGETVFVSGAAGAVGSLVGQIAKLKGAAAVVGSAGGPAKTAWLVDEVGFDAAIDYKAVQAQGGSLRAALREKAPDGVDVYFDNVGGDHLEAAIGCLRLHGRAAICGMISQYNALSTLPGPANLPLLIQNRLTLRGFLVGDHADARPAFIADMGGWLREGRVVWRETVVDGLENAVNAFRGLLSGDNTGKMLVRLSE